MQDPFRRHARPIVKCDGGTMTQSDIDNGIVNIEVSFAPLKPYEFFITEIQQIARVTVE